MLAKDAFSRQRVFIFCAWAFLIVSFGLDFISSYLVSNHTDEILAMGRVDRLFETNPNLAPLENRAKAYLYPVIPYVVGMTVLSVLAITFRAKLSSSKNGRFDLFMFILAMLTISFAKSIAGVSNFGLYFFGTNPFHMLTAFIEGLSGTMLQRESIFYINSSIAILVSFGLALTFLNRVPIFVQPLGER